MTMNDNIPRQIRQTDRDRLFSAAPHLVWLYTGSLAHALDAATWLDTTRALRQLGWRVTLVAAGPAGQRCIRGVEVFCIYRPNLYLTRQLVFHLQFLWLLLWQWATVEIVLFHQMSAPWLLAVRLFRGLMGRQRPLLVMDIRTLNMRLRGKESHKDRLRGGFHGLMSRVALHWVDGYLTITQRMAESLHIPPDRLWGVWPSGVNLEQFASAGSLRRWPLPRETIHLIYLGALSHERNLLALSQAVEQANAEGMAFHLTLAGEGTGRAELEKFAAQQVGQIHVMRPVPHDQVPELLARAHVGVLPFPDEEEFRVSSHIKMFEYMAAGLPILATHVASHTDVVGHGTYVFWAEKSDNAGLLLGLRQVWQNREALSAMGAEAAAAAGDWTWQASAQKLSLSLEQRLAH